MAKFTLENGITIEGTAMELAVLMVAHVTAKADEVGAEEADAIERKKSAVFTDAGRKPNEYREGDIIRYKGDEDGRVYEVSHVRNGEVHFFDNTFGNRTEFMELGAIILISFVENRLDRN